MPHHSQDQQRNPHLLWQREERSVERRKATGSGPKPALSREARISSANNLETAVVRITEAQAQKSPLPAGIQPHLVFRVPLKEKANATEASQVLEKAGLTVVGIEAKRAIIAFREDTDLSSFQAALGEYRNGPREGLNPNTGNPYKSTAYDAFQVIEAEQMQLWQSSDRSGPRLAQEIGPDAALIVPDKRYVVEIELWHSGDNISARNKLGEVRQLVEFAKADGERFLDQYQGATLLLAKVAVYGRKLRQLLELDAVAEVELPPVITFSPRDTFGATARDFPPCPPPLPDGPRLCILDSGIAANHPLLGPYVGDEAAILTADDAPADTNGHGTMVGGIAVFGDVRAAYKAGSFASDITLFSARVLNAHNRFDDNRLIINQMREAITTFACEPYHCRVFNLSLGEETPALSEIRPRQPQWAEILDILARELQVVLVVSAGNRNFKTRNQAEAEQLLTEYPRYLFAPEAGLCDPATAALAVTVGSLVQHDEVAPNNANDIARPIARAGQPSPFTRVGAGLNQAIKPEFVHYGGNLVFDGYGQQRGTGYNNSADVMSLSHEPLQRLFAFAAGSSFAAPRVARIAALLEYRLREMLSGPPHPNLIRAVLAGSASVPAATLELLAAYGGADAAFRVCGYGLPDEDLAFTSGERSVMLIAQESIQLDYFHVFGIPITDAFAQARGKKTISVALAYDPPVRRRLDYLGVEMEMSLIRGKNLEEVIAAYQKIVPGEEFPERFADRYRLPLKPGSQGPRNSDHKYSRKKSTLQVGRCTMLRPGAYGDTYWLVVRAEKKWAQTHEQAYAVAVTLTADDPQLYVQVQQRNRLRSRPRVRV